MTTELFIKICKLKEKDNGATKIMELLNITEDDYIDYINSIEYFINGKLQKPTIKMAGDWKELQGPIKTLSKDPYLYIISFGDNRLKFGMSSDINDRLYKHNASCFVFSGRELQKATIIGPFSDLKSKESELLALVEKSNKFKSILTLKFSYGSEWFIGNFEDAIELGKELIKNHCNLPFD